VRSPVQTSLPGQITTSNPAQSSAAMFNFPPPQRTTARFGPINVHFDDWSDYGEPTIYALSEQQQIVNWGDVRGLRFSGDGLGYMQCLRLHRTTERPIVIGDNLVFIYCPQCAFTPQQPSRTLFLVTHVLYTVVFVRDAMFYFDHVEVLYNYVDMHSLFQRIACLYVGTYILFSTTGDSVHTLPSDLSPNIPDQNSTLPSHNSALQSARTNSLQRRPSANASSSSSSSAAGQGHSRATSINSAIVATPAGAGSTSQRVDYDSDDSQVKKKTKVAALEWHGKTFYVTGKESAINILRDTFSVRTLMEEGQLQHLVNHVGDFVNNYTSDIFKTGHSKSALMAGMNLTATANHDLDRFQSLACFAIKELQDNLYFQKYCFPDARTTFSLCAEHYLTKSDADACNFEIVSYDYWVRSWKGYQLVLKLLLGPSYGSVLSDIVAEIQQNNIGQYNDVEYLLSLTATMRALLYEYSSSVDDFTIDTDTTVYTTALMTTALWLHVI
jgi:hypothetical protein